MPRKRILGYPVPFFIMMSLLVLDIFMVFVLFLTGYKGLAEIISFVGTPLIMFGTLAYVVFIDSRTRWPKLNAYQRFLNVITFTR